MNKSNEKWFKNHLSPSLTWKWHFQDFRVMSVEEIGVNSFVAKLRPRFPIFQRVIQYFYKSKIPITTLTSTRLAFLVSIIAAGYILNRDKKDGEVIARSINMNCKKPLVYSYNSVIEVFVKINFKRSTSNYDVFDSEYGIGSNREHNGTTTLLYCKPGTSGISYL